MDEKILEIEELLTKADELIVEGKTEEARALIAQAKKKNRRPIGTGTNGVER